MKGIRSLTRLELAEPVSWTAIAEEVESVTVTIGCGCGVIARSTELNVFVLLSSLTVLSEVRLRRKHDRRRGESSILLL